MENSCANKAVVALVDIRESDPHFDQPPDSKIRVYVARCIVAKILLSINVGIFLVVLEITFNWTVRYMFRLTLRNVSCFH